MRPRQAAGLQLQAPRVLPVMRCPAHVADRRPPGDEPAGVHAAAGDREDLCSPGLGPSAAAQGSGARGGAALRCLSRSALCGLGREPFQAHSWGVLWRLKILCQAITPARTARAEYVPTPTKALQRYSNTQFCLFTIKSIRMKGLHRIGSVEVLLGNLVSVPNLGGWSAEHPMCACRKWSKGRMDLWLFELSEA